METGFIDKIPIRNIWLLMLYASDLFRQCGQGKRAIEDNPDDIPDLVAENLIYLVERRLKRNLSYGYQKRSAIISRIRGHVDLLNTSRRQLLKRGMISCTFEELSVDTKRNRYIRSALETIAKIVGRSELKHKCRTLANNLRELGVIGEKPAQTEIATEHYSHHDLDDQYLISIAHLAFQLALPTERSGTKLLSIPDRDINWMRKLFEKAIAGFYKVVLGEYGWRVETSKILKWQIEHKSNTIDRILPVMRSDIVLENESLNRRIIIDTKFTSILKKGRYRKETLKSSYIYQIYTYLRSQEGTDDMSNHATGLLLHPSIGEMVNESVVIQGHGIHFATVDLSESALVIRQQLQEVIHQLLPKLIETNNINQ